MSLSVADRRTNFNLDANHMLDFVFSLSLDILVLAISTPYCCAACATYDEFWFPQNADCIYKTDYSILYYFFGAPWIVYGFLESIFCLPWKWAIFIIDTACDERRATSIEWHQLNTQTDRAYRNLDKMRIFHILMNTKCNRKYSFLKWRKETKKNNNNIINKDCRRADKMDMSCINRGATRHIRFWLLALSRMRLICHLHELTLCFFSESRSNVWCRLLCGS